MKMSWRNSGTSMWILIESIQRFTLSCPCFRFPAQQRDLVGSCQVDWCQCTEGKRGNRDTQVCLCQRELRITNPNTWSQSHLQYQQCKGCKEIVDTRWCVCVLQMSLFLSNGEGALTWNLSIIEANTWNKACFVTNRPKNSSSSNL